MAVRCLEDYSGSEFSLNIKRDDSVSVKNLSSPVVIGDLIHMMARRERDRGGIQVQEEPVSRVQFV